MKLTKRKGIVLAVGAFLALMLIMGLVWYAARPATSSGGKHITVEVIHGDGSSKDFAFDTEEEYLGTALMAEGLIEGSESTYGLYVDVVDGERADFSTNGSYWALSINGEYAQTGADSTPIRDGDAYTWTYTTG